jgi:hypothetical protein
VGATAGVTNNVIFQHLTNLSSTPATVTYTVIGSAQLCETPFEEFIVTVLPQPSANMSLAGPDVVCRDENVMVRFDFVGDAPFIAEFLINGELQPPVLSEDASTIIPVPVSEDAFFAFIGYRDRNCTGEPNGVFSVSVLEPGETHLDISVCEGDTVEVAGHKITFAGLYEYTIEDASSNGCDSIVTLDLEVFEHEETDLEMHLCEGETVTVGSNTYSETGFYSDTLQTIHGCDSIVNLLLTISNEIVSERNMVICAGSSVEFGGETLFADGTYYDTIPITPTCDSIYILNLNVLNVIVLIQTVIEPDTGQSSGSIMIQVAGGIPPYQYLWSNSDTTNHPMHLDPGNYSLTVTDVLGCTAEYNFFLISSTNELLPGFSEILVFPNPAMSGAELQISMHRAKAHEQLLEIRILDPQGRMITARQQRLQREKELVTVAIHDIPPGLYFIQFTDHASGGSLARKLIIHDH